MDTALTQKFPCILDMNLAKANCTENDVCTSCVYSSPWHEPTHIYFAGVAIHTKVIFLAYRPLSDNSGMERNLILIY